MVRIGEYELRLVRPGGGQPCPEVTGPDGVAYAVAEPGAAFEVQLTRHPEPCVSKPDGTYHNARLDLDGLYVGYDKIFDTAVCHTFQGFLKAADAQGSTFKVQGFVFSQPLETEAKQFRSAGAAEEGEVVCKVTSARFTGGVCAQQRLIGSGATNESVGKLPEDTKFYLAPSLATGRGELKTGDGFDMRASEYAGPVGGVATLRLRYETAATLLLRGVLQRGDPAHLAILKQFLDTAETQGVGAASPSPGRAGERRKRRRQQASAAAAGQGGEVIDLTNTPDPRDEVLAAKRAYKVLRCDLTQAEEEDGGPEWRAVSLTVHTVASSM